VYNKEMKIMEKLVNWYLTEEEMIDKKQAIYMALAPNTDRETSKNA
jgi:hypothetical protein